uniref:Solute carrier family 26, member 8 n=1 Tax=Jaculus jaculus TaxID=51337 RepID=A0A8C5L2Y4_JACJA
MQTDWGSLGFGHRYRPNSFLYDVKRNVYNEENFQQEHRRRAVSSGNVDIDITTFRHHVQCRCSWHKFLKCMLTIFPFLEWICLYRFKDWLLGDLLAGISVGLVQVPQGLTLSLLTRQLIPPLNITYASFCTSVIYVIFGSCHQMSIGPFFLVSALLIDVLKESPFNSGHLIMGTFVKDDFSLPAYFINYNKSLSVVATTTFLTGIIQLSMGMVGVGFMATYLPDAVVNAFLAAVALHIILAQITCIFGIMISFHAGPISFFYNIINYCMALPRANSTSILLFLTAVVALRINKCIRISFNQYPIEFPMELLLILGFSIIANKINMATETSQTLIDMIPYRSVATLELKTLSVLCAAPQDLIAMGLCNVISSFFRSCVLTGAVARTIIQDKSGGRQQFASLVGAGVMLLLMVKTGRFFYKLPNAVLAGIVLSNVLPYLETIYNLPSLWRQDQYDCVVWLVTFSSAIFLGLDMGLLISLVFAFFIITVRSHRTKILLLGQIPNTNIYRSSSDYREVLHFPGVKIFQCCNSVTFVNVYQLRHKLLKETNMVRVPLTEEEVFQLFNDSETTLQDNNICRCFCDCDEMELPPRSDHHPSIMYVERFENKEDYDASSINLIRCSFLGSRDASQNTSEEQVPYTVASPSQRNQGQSFQGSGWISSHPVRNSEVSLEGAENAGQGRAATRPYSDTSLPASIHTVILDFSMVHYVDSRALVVLRQMCNAFQNANIVVLIAGCHPSVVRAFEKNDFFDHGITKAQLFLSLHDAVLSALAKKLPEPSELSVDESETVIQDTYSESDKNGKMGGDLMKNTQNASPGFIKAEESELRLDMDPMLVSEEDNELDLDFNLDLDLDRDLGLNRLTDSELVLGLDSELDPETNSQFAAEPKPRPELEMEPELTIHVDQKPESRPKSRSRLWSQGPSQQPSLPGYLSGPSSSQAQVPQTLSMERRRPPRLDLHPSQG